MRSLFRSPLLLSISQLLGLALGGGLQYLLRKQIGMALPFSLMLLFCFAHQYMLRRKGYLPTMPEQLRRYLHIAALWSFCVIILYSLFQYHRLSEIVIVLPILFFGMLVMDLAILLCMQEVVRMICPSTPAILQKNK